MKKECVLLTDNLMLACQIKDIGKSYNICVSACKYIFEMLEKLNEGTNAVLIDRSLNYYDNLQDYVSDAILNKVYFLQNDSVFNNKNVKEFENIDKFFQSKIFEHVINKKSPINYEEQVNKKLGELGIVMNSWKARFIKYILCEMKNRDERHVNREIIETVGASKEVACKHIYDSLRPILKDFICKLDQKTNKVYETKKVRVMIDSLYSYVFE